MSGWLFPMGAGLFTQSRWWFAHTGSSNPSVLPPVCEWRVRHRTDAPSRAFQSRLGALMTAERRA